MEARRLHDAYLAAQERSAMTAGALPTAFVRLGEGEVAVGELGDELRAFGEAGADGELRYALRARLLHVVPCRLIVLVANCAGAEVRLNHIDVPNYKVRVPDTGEVGPLSAIVNTHWSLLYWEPMREYFKLGGAAA